MKFVAEENGRISGIKLPRLRFVYHKLNMKRFEFEIQQWRTSIPHRSITEPPRNITQLTIFKIINIYLNFFLKDNGKNIEGK